MFRLASDRKHRSCARAGALLATGLGVLLTVSALPSAASAAPTTVNPVGPAFRFTTLDNDNDTTFNQLLGINDSQVISGYFGSGNPATTNPNKGYTLAPPYSSSNYSNENYPGSQQTQVTGINNAKNTVGFWTDTAGDNYGFAEINGTFKSFTDPLTSANPTFNQLLGVNNNGLAAGFYNDAAGHSHGYTLDLATGVFTPVNPPGAVSATAASVNDQGDVAGFFTDAGKVTHGFLDKAGTFTTLDYPAAVSTSAFGVNNADEVVGTYTDAAGSGHGFTDINGNFTSVDEPDADPANGGTVINGVNNQGDVVGFYMDGGTPFLTHGFLGTPTNMPGNPYAPVAPFRICDTRGTQPANQCNGEGTRDNPLGPGGTLTVQVTGQDNPEVPADATAAVLNVTVTATTAPSYLTAWAAGSNRPLASNLNWVAGQTTTNLVEVPIGQNGQINLYNYTGSTQVVADLEGYVAPQVTADGSGLFNSLVPARICDTRLGAGVAANQCNSNGTKAGTLGPGGTQDIQVTGNGGVPASGVSAVVLNVTATGTTAASYLTAFAQGTIRPTASNLNWVAGQTVANRVIVPVSASGAITVYNHAGSTDVAVDVNGYYTNAGDDQTGMVYTPLWPARICDTRTVAGSGANQCNSYGAFPGTLGPAGSRTVQVAGLGGVPGQATLNTFAPAAIRGFGTRAVVMNTTVTDTTAASFLTVWPDGVAQPATSDLNWVAGQTVPNLVVVGLGPPNGAVDLFNHAGSTDAVADVEGYYGPNNVFTNNPTLRSSTWSDLDLVGPLARDVGEEPVPRLPPPLPHLPAGFGPSARVHLQGEVGEPAGGDGQPEVDQPVGDHAEDGDAARSAVPDQGGGENGLDDPQATGGDGQGGEDVGQPEGDEQAVGVGEVAERAHEHVQRGGVENPVGGRPEGRPHQHPGLGTQLGHPIGQAVEEILDGRRLDEGDVLRGSPDEGDHALLATREQDDQHHEQGDQKQADQPGDAVDGGEPPDGDGDDHRQPEDDVEDHGRAQPLGGESEAGRRSIHPRLGEQPEAEGRPRRGAPGDAVADRQGRHLDAEHGDQPGVAATREHGTGQLGVGHPGAPFQQDADDEPGHVDVAQQADRLAGTGDLGHDQVLDDQGDDPELDQRWHRPGDLGPPPLQPRPRGGRRRRATLHLGPGAVARRRGADRRHSHRPVDGKPEIELRRAAGVPARHPASAGRPGTARGGPLARLGGGASVPHHGRSPSRTRRADEPAARG